MATREERLEYARLLIRRHPEWGEPRLNLSLKTEYGAGLRRVDLARLKQEMIFAEGKYTPPDDIAADNRIISMGFVEAQQVLTSAGFLPKEIRELFSAHGVVDMLNSQPFKEMMRERRRWVKEMRHAGMSTRQIMDSIKEWYSRDEKRSPFEFLRREYKPPLKVTRTEYREAIRRRANRQVKKLYGGRRRNA